MLTHHYEDVHGGDLFGNRLECGLVALWATSMCKGAIKSQLEVHFILGARLGTGMNS